MGKLTDTEKMSEAKSNISSQSSDEAKLQGALDAALESDVQASEALNDTFAQLRRNALDQIPEKQSVSFNKPLAVSVLAGIAAAVLLVVMWVPQAGFDSSVKNSELSELDFYTQSEDIAMFTEEDPEFYLWLVHELQNEAS